MMIDDFGFLIIVFFVLSKSKVDETKSNIMVDIIGSAFLYLNLYISRYI